MRYTILPPANDEGSRASGLSLSEAFARVMALAQCDYVFGRIDGDMRLTVNPADEASGRPAPIPECRSKSSDDAQARADIMHDLLARGINGCRAVAEKAPQCEWRRRDGQANLPAAAAS